jgi:hypothetical protein
MRVALVSFCPPHNRTSQEILKTLASASTRSGNQVDIINGLEDLVNSRLTMYDYIAVVVLQAGAFSTRLSPRVSAFLSSSGSITGKKGCALVIKAGFFSGKLCGLLMKVMEKEGVRLDYYDVVRSLAMSANVGKKIG